MFESLSDKLQNIFSGLRSKGHLTEADIDVAMKEIRMENEYSRADGLVDAILMRDAEGKDIVSNYQQYIKAVTLEGVRSALRDLDMGSKVEYVIK